MRPGYGTRYDLERVGDPAASAAGRPPRRALAAELGAEHEQHEPERVASNGLRKGDLHEDWQAMNFRHRRPAITGTSLAHTWPVV